MPLLHSATDALEIIYHRDYRILIGRFLRPLPDEEQNRQCYLELLAAAQAHAGCRYWLLDIRRRGRSGQQVLEWLQASFYQQLVRELGRPVCVVYFMAPGLREEFLASADVPEPQTYAPDAPFRINQCITEGAAVDWLLAEQAGGAG